MEIKILQVFYGKDGLPYKDKNRQVHFPITGTGFLGASNTTKIKFYYDELNNLDETTWVAVSKLPNGKVGSRVLESYLDEELNEHYALLELDNYYTQYKGDVFISLQGYQGGVDFDYDEESSQYEIHGTPTIAATGSIKFTINYANQFVGSGETDNINFQRILAALGTKLGMRAYSEHVTELPSEGSPDVFYVVNDDPNNPNIANIYVWNENTRHYIWVGDNTLDLGEYYTKNEGQTFEENVNEQLEDMTETINSLGQLQPSGVDTSTNILAFTENKGIYIGSDTGYWYYWNGTQYVSGGVYISSLPDEHIDQSSTNSVRNSAICELVKKLPITFDKVVNTCVDFTNATQGEFTPTTKIFFASKTHLNWQGDSTYGSGVALNSPNLETGIEYTVKYTSNVALTMYLNAEYSYAQNLIQATNRTFTFTIPNGTTPQILLIPGDNTAFVDFEITINKTSEINKDLNATIENIYQEIVKAKVDSVDRIKVLNTKNIDLVFSSFDYPTNQEYDEHYLSWEIANGLDGGYNIDFEDLDMSKYLNVSFDYSANNYPSEFMVWLGVITNSDERVLVAQLKNLSTAGSVELEIDCSHYAVYNDAKSLYLIINTSTVNANTKVELNNFLINQNEAQNLPISAPKLDGTLKNISVKLTELDEREISAEIDLVSPNGTKYVLTVANDGTLVTQKVIPQKALFIGNSLTLGFGTFGMCASGNTKDYYKKFNDYILTKEPSYTATRYLNGNMVSGYSFEDSSTEEQCLAWITNALLPVLSNDLDLVVLQLGDNSAIGGTVLYNNCVNTIRAVRANCPKARVVFMSAWYTNTDRQTQIQNACKATGATFVNIFGLAANGGTNAVGNVVTLDSDQTTTYTCTYTDDDVNKELTLTITIGGSTYNPTISYTSYTDNGNGTITVIGPQVVITNDGIASHPGDTGMLRIANKLAYELGIISQEGEIE